jgi:hypothetical protein
MMFIFSENFDDQQREEAECRNMESMRAAHIAAAIQNNPCHHFAGFGAFVVGRHITIVEIIDELGDVHLIPIPSDNLLQWEANGMLRAAL